MQDIIITGKQGSGKSQFAEQYFGHTHTIVDGLTLPELKQQALSTDRPGIPYVFITQDSEGIDFPSRRFITIQMPEK